MSGDVRALAEVILELLGEWRRTCRTMSLRWSDDDAAEFVAEGLTGRIAAERADAARQALAPVLALADEWRAIQGDPGAYGDGARGAFRQAAAQVARAAAGGGEDK